MALAFKCDICGKLYEGRKELSVSSNPHRVTDTISIGSLTENGYQGRENASTGNYFLCPDCYKKILTVLGNGKDDSDKKEKA